MSMQQPSSSPTETENGDQPVDSVPMYRKKRIMIPLLLFVIAAAGTAWYWYTNVRGFDSTDDAFIDGNRVTISPKMLGRISVLLTDEGQTVTKDSLLLRLDDSDLRAQEQQAKAALAAAQENVNLALVNRDKAKEDLDRTATQYRSSVVPKEQYDHAQKTYQSAAAQYALTIAQVATARAQLGIVETQLQNTIIRSPMNGVVAKRWALPGEIIQPGQPIFTLYDLSSLWVTANFEETKIGSIHLGDAVEISVDAYPGETFHGKIIQLGASTGSQFSLIPPNNASGNFTKVTQRIPVKISLGGTAGSDPPPLLPGMSVEVRVREQ